MYKKIFLILFSSFTLAASFFIDSPHAFAAPPAGFKNILLVDSGLSAPTGLGIAPDGRIFILEQGGKIKIYKDGAILPRDFDELPSDTHGDRGLLGIAFDPDFNTNHYVYFYYIDAVDLVHKVVRFNASSDIATDGPVLIYSSNFPAGFNHAGGTIQFGPDGKLYIGIGDSGQGSDSQDLTKPDGKILRINKDGSIPTDNPFIGTPNTLPEIWAYGFRNPFRFQFDSQTGFLYVGDVGLDTWEEMNRIVKGGNYGWPAAEGVCPSTCSYINPIYSYLHTTPGFAIAGGPIYRSTMFPSGYIGKLFFADYGKGFLKTMSLDESGNQTSVDDFDPNVGSIVDMKVGNDGALYYVTIFPGSLHKIAYDNGNQFPITVSSADTVSGQNPLTVNFSGSGSSDPEGIPLSYNWDFGDGTLSTSSNPIKTYTKRGMYTVGMKTSDGVNISRANSMTVTVGTPPTLSITTPPEGMLFKDGDTVSYSATGIDSDGNNLPDSAFTREVILHHNTHIHPFLRSIQSRNGTFTIPTTGESSSDIWYELIMTATDANGLRTSKSVSIRPKEANVILESNPSGLQITVGGVPYTTRSVLQAVVGFGLDLDINNQTLGGINYEFDHWTDNGFKNRTVSVPEAGAAYTAVFRQAAPFNAEYFNNINLSGEPVLVRTDPIINFIWNDGSPDPAIHTDNFSARWTKQQNFAFGRYKFNVSTDDGARLYIDGKLVIDEWKDQGVTTYSVILDLSAGMHEIKMEYYDSNGGAIAKLNWDTTPDQPPLPTYPNYKGEYFDNKNLTGTPKIIRNDQSINFIWDHSSPDVSLPADQFSTRWTKTQNFAAGNYEFSVTADDGVRMYIDNELLVDKWTDQPSTTYTAVKNLTSGNHDIKIEYYENFGGAVAKFSFQKIADTLPAGYTAQYWNTPKSSSAPLIPDTAPDLAREDADIHFIWNDGSPDPLINPNHFVVQWQHDKIFTAGSHTFTVTADDGVRLYIDNVLVIDKWKDQGKTPYAVTKDLSAGIHNIKMEYYENAGGAVAILQEN